MGMMPPVILQVPGMDIKHVHPVQNLLIEDNGARVHHKTVHVAGLRKPGRKVPVVLHLRILESPPIPLARVTDILANPCPGREKIVYLEIRVRHQRIQTSGAVPQKAHL